MAGAFISEPHLTVQSLGVTIVQAGKNIHLHCFSKESDLAKVWRQKIKRDITVKNDPHFCTDFFPPVDFKRDLQFELLNPGIPSPCFCLIPVVVPSLRISFSH